jgi:hypothetical protein
MRFVAVIPTLWAAAAAALHSSLDGRPRLQLGGTALVGKYLQASNLDFFGGYNFLIITRCPPHFSIQVSLLPSLQSAAIAFLLPTLSILFLPCNRSMPVATVSRACNL